MMKFILTAVMFLLFAQTMVAPVLSAMVMMVLLNVAWIVTIPEVIPFKDFFLVLVCFLFICSVAAACLGVAINDHSLIWFF